jgi:cysteine desulfurase/selenocysteine lyase
MTRFGIPGTARASLAVYNTEQDVAALVDALGEAQKLFGTGRRA